MQKVLVVIAMVVTGCGGAGAAATGEGATSTTAPTAASPSGDGGGGGEIASADVALGEARYDAMCSLCHPGGEADIGPAIRDIQWSPERVRTQIRDGSGRMRPIGPDRLSDEDMEAMLAYLVTLGTVSTP